MPGSIAKARLRFQHLAPLRQQHSAHTWQAQAYRSATQLTAAPNDSALLNAAGIFQAQEIIGVLCIAPVVQWTIPSLWPRWAFSRLHQSPKPQPQRWNSYSTTVPPAPKQSFARFHASNMFLHVHSNSSCLSEGHARSRSGDHFFLSSHPADPHTVPLPDSPPLPLYGPVHVPSSIMRVVLSSATEAEMGVAMHHAGRPRSSSTANAHPDRQCMVCRWHYQ